MIVNIPQQTERNQTCKIYSEKSKYTILFHACLWIRNVNLLNLSCRFHGPAGGRHWKFYQLPHRDFQVNLNPLRCVETESTWKMGDLANWHLPMVY